MLVVHASGPLHWRWTLSVASTQLFAVVTLTTTGSAGRSAGFGQERVWEGPGRLSGKETLG